MVDDARPLPPGGRWFPLIGETLAFLASPFEFVERRVKDHGPIFRTHLLGKPTVILAGGETAGVFADEKTCLRDGSMPDHVRELFGGRSLPLLDGDPHLTRKRQVLAALVPETFADYLPDMQAVIEARLGELAGRGPVAVIPELKRLAIEVIAKNMLGMDRGADLDALLEGYQVLLAGFTGLPIPLPGTAYKKALRARDAIFAILRRAVAEHEKDPSKSDGLARVLAHRDEKGAAIGAEGAAMEMHHVFIAGYIVFAQLASILLELARDPALQRSLREEVALHAPSGALTLRQIGSMRALGDVVQETKRFTPVVPLSFGRARTTFEVGGYRIPEGTMLFWAPFTHNQDASVYPAPRTFDPGRFSEARAEHGKHPFAFAPQGMGATTGHKCAGVDYSTLFLQVFTAIVLRDFSYAIPDDQDVDLDLARIPPEPRSGLLTAFERGVADSGDAALRPSQRRPVRPSELPPLVPDDPLGIEALLALAEIAWADGRMAKEEAEALVQIARALGLDPSEVAMLERATMDRPGPSQGAPLALAADESERLFTLACMIAAADGDVDPREHAAIAGLGDRLRLDGATRERAAAAARAVGSTIRESSVLKAVAAELEPPA
ncbi:MAG: cytochrome P450 [Deltaproteobacteria bacterium]|nr:cytochrome P450 [Deltaproteobacteria bacterium]